MTVILYQFRKAEFESPRIFILGVSRVNFGPNDVISMQGFRSWGSLRDCEIRTAM